MKRCSKCGEEKDLSEFSRQYDRKSGYCSNCKSCQKCYYEKTKEIRNRQSKEWRKTHHIEAWAYGTYHNHKEKGYRIEFTSRYLIDMAKKTVYCPICGIKLNWSRGNKGGQQHSNSPTLDRMNNGKILTEQNIEILCNQCNARKHTMTLEEGAWWALKFRDWCISKMENIQNEECL